MTPRFDALYSGPETDLSLVVGYPDLIYTARYQAAAARSHRYRYAVTDARNKHDITVIRGTVYLDGRHCSDFLRVEYRAGRLIAPARAAGRRLGDSVLAWVRFDGSSEATVRLHRCPAVEAFQVELWATLEAPPGSDHDHAVLRLMGRDAPITRPRGLSAALAAVAGVRRVELAFREGDRTPDGMPVADPHWDNNFHAAVHVPAGPAPDDPANLVDDPNYLIHFARGFFRPAGSVGPTHFRNWRLAPDDPAAAPDNVVARRWLGQREFAGRMVYCAEGTIPPGGSEGCHRHVGAEEVLYVVLGTGLGYVAADDLPDADKYPVAVRPVFGIGPRPCRELPLGPGAVVLTKGGGVHGLTNTGAEPLVYLAFLYQTD